MSLKVFGMKCEELRWSQRREKEYVCVFERERERDREREREVSDSFQLKHLWLTS